MPLREVATITEQRSCVVASLSEGEAGALAKLGQTLRAKAAGYEDTDVSDGEEVDGGPTVIQVDRKPGDKGWRVFVRNAVGVIGVDDLQIIVEPKIPVPHFDYLRLLSSEPDRLRLAEGGHSVESAESYLASVWIGYLDALAITLRADLHHDYVEVEDDPPYIRGRLDLRRAATNLSRGTLRFPTVYEDLSVDNPVNRILRAACIHVSALSGRIVGGANRDQDSPQAEIYLKILKRANEASYHLAQASDLRPGDLNSEMPRLALHQHRAVHLAKQILEAVGRTFRVGDNTVSCFLYPTPPIIEGGLRNLLDNSLQDVTVTKESRSAAGLTFNPDLVVRSATGTNLGVIATGDVKYRLRSEDWPRPTLEQAVVFSEVFGATQGFFVDFDVVNPSRSSRSELIDGRLYHRISWPATEDMPPNMAADHVVDEIRNLLAGVG